MNIHSIPAFQDAALAARFAIVQAFPGFCDIGLSMKSKFPHTLVPTYSFLHHFCRTCIDTIAALDAIGMQIAVVVSP